MAQAVDSEGSINDMAPGVLLDLKPQENIGGLPPQSLKSKLPAKLSGLVHRRVDETSARHFADVLTAIEPTSVAG